MRRIALAIWLACACATARAPSPAIVILYPPTGYIAPPKTQESSSTISGDGWRVDPDMLHSLTKMPEKCKNFHEGENGRRVTWCDCTLWVDNAADWCWP